MKALFSFLLVIGFSFCTFAQNNQQLNWVSLEEAEEIQSKNPEKQIFVNFYATWCGFCRKMDKQTFKDKEVIQFLNDNYILVKFDAESKEEYKFKDKTYRYVKGANGRGVNFFAYSKLRGKLGYPTSVLLDENGSVKFTLNGYLSPEQIVSNLEQYAKIEG